MKRKGHLINEVAQMDNLYLAFWKAKKGKDGKKEVLEFSKALQSNLSGLKEEILSGSLSVGDYHYFTIYDPKERLICASSFKERVLQHALMNVCHPIFEKYQIYDSYACRKGKGTYAALDRAKSFAVKYRWFAKLDVRKYFETIDHDILKKQLSRMFKDKKLLSILYQIIDSYQNLTNRGLPIGNLSSQYFANHFLGVADHFIKETLKVKAYIRYMDDMVIFQDSPNALKTKVRLASDFIENNLCCELKAPILNKMDKGLPFLGYVVFTNKTNLAKRSRKRFRKKTKKLYALLQKGDISQGTYQRKMLPLLAFIEKADAHLFKKNIILPLENN